MNTTMEYKGFKAEIQEANRLRGERVFELPKGTALPVYHADEFINYPENWMKGPGVFVVPVRPEKGLWFNWRMNDELNTAILPTVKGANPITGLQTSGFHLEAYEKKCPKHNCDFMADRFCPECDFRWPTRNYVSMAPLWWDGFRADDGTVRQFFFTEEELRDVATHMIGRENTVPAFGFAFYTPKEQRAHLQVDNSRGVTLDSFPSPTFTLTSTLGGIPKGSMDKLVTSNNNDMHIYNTSLIHKDIKTENKMSDNLGSGELAASYCSDGGPVACAGGPISAEPCAGGASVEDSGEEKTSGGGIIVPDSALYEAPKKMSKFSGRMKKSRFLGEGESKGVLRSAGLQVNSTPRPKPVRDVSIGAGAKIRQALNHDPYPLESWKEAPDASMTVYFVFQEKLEELKSKGMRDVTGTKEGMLKDIPVG